MFSVEHVLSCTKGGFPSIKHTEIKKLTVSLLTEVCHDVIVQPVLEPVVEKVILCASENSQDGAQVNTAASGWVSA